jgi:acyl-CoA thioesterase FadM
MFSLIAVAAVLFLILGWWRNLPGMYHVILARHLFSQFFFAEKRAAPLDLRGPVVTHHRCWLDDCDWNFHMNNASYFRYMDYGRIELIWRSGLFSLARRKGYLVALGGVSLQYRRELRPFQNFMVHTETRGWDKKWLFIHATFSVRGKDGQQVTAASGVMKVVLKNKREDVPVSKL